MPRRSGLASGLLLGSALDALLADPRRGHPVAAFGTAAARAEGRLWRASRARGALFTVACAGPAVAAGWAAQRLAGRRPLPGAAVAAAATWAVLGGASLAAEAAGVSRALAAGDLDDARHRLPALCGRDPAGLPAAELARAAVESVAENTCDAVVAPLLWGAVAGVGGLLGYRAVNTLDAMVGHHDMRYERFGWAAARLDDVANLVPARLTAVLAAALAPAVGGSGRRGPAHRPPRRGRASQPERGPLRGRVRRGARGQPRRHQRLPGPGRAAWHPRRRPPARARRPRSRHPAVPPDHHRDHGPRRAGGVPARRAGQIAGNPASGTSQPGRANSRLSWVAQPQHSFVMVGPPITNEDLGGVASAGAAMTGLLAAGTAA